MPDLLRARGALLQRLLHIDGVFFNALGRQQRLVGVNCDFHECRAGLRQRLIEHVTSVLGEYGPITFQAHGLGDAREIDGLQIAFTFRIAQEHHRFPFDLAEGIVLDHISYTGPCVR